MTSHPVRRLWFTGVALCLVRIASLALFALSLSATLLGCGAAPAYEHGPWAQSLPSGVRVFRVCRRHPRVNPKAPYWYEEGDGTPRTALVPIEEILEGGSVKAVFVHDPHAPPESRKVLGLEFEKLPCDEPPPPLPPPPKTIAAKKAPAREKVERAEKTSKKKAQTTVRTVMRRRLAQTDERPRRGPPDRRFLGQTAPEPAPCHVPLPVLPELSERAVQEYEDWGIEPADVSALTKERGRECLEKLCHARHPSFIPKGRKPKGAREGQSCSTGSGSGTSPKQPAPKPAPKPAAKPAPKSTVKTTVRPEASGAGRAKGPVNGETAATKAGRQAHKDWDPGPGFQKEVRLPSGKRPDAVNLKTREVKELKPDHPRAIKRGEKQVEEYRKELEAQEKKKWTGTVETYKRK